jgi:hypothetical protein
MKEVKRKKITIMIKKILWQTFTICDDDIKMCYFHVSLYMTASSIFTSIWREENCRWKTFILFFFVCFMFEWKKRMEKKFFLFTIDTMNFYRISNLTSSKNPYLHTHKKILFSHKSREILEIEECMRLSLTRIIKDQKILLNNSQSFSVTEGEYSPSHTDIHSLHDCYFVDFHNNHIEQRNDCFCMFQNDLKDFQRKWNSFENASCIWSRWLFNQKTLKFICHRHLFTFTLFFSFTILKRIILKKRKCHASVSWISTFLFLNIFLWSFLFTSHSYH